ncbi:MULTISPECIES: RICIN domain-containing protein [Streptomyces]|uniref:RICIN domain-containing protein n=1 Tax=Streptomyces flaveolus TaxID=67297 RepID=A0ABV3AR82_9ACTN|nr:MULTISPECIES: RICIN domain-containing protein [Streptomyces]
MKPPHTPRSAGDLPRRVPGSARSVSSGSGPGRDGTPAGGAEPSAPDSGDRAPDAAGRGTSLPRLTQISSLGSRGNTGRGTGTSSPAADDAVGGSAADRPGDTFARRADTDDSPAVDPVVSLDQVCRGKGGKPRREGMRGALGVVSIVGLLAAGGVLLTLGLVNGHDDDKRDGASVTVDSRGRGTDVIDGFGGVSAPPVKASATGPGKKAEASRKPTSASPSSSASSEDSASPAQRSTTTAKATTGARTTAPAAAPGVNVFSHASQRCIDIVGGKAVQGAGLMIWDCSGSAAQHWTFTGGTMRALGMCVRLANGSTADGTDLELAACDGSSAQQFVLNVRHDLVSTLADKCTDVRDNGTENGTRLQLWSCSGSPNQKWSTS